MKKTLLILMTILFLLAALAACGGVAEPEEILPLVEAKNSILGEATKRESLPVGRSDAEIIRIRETLPPHEYPILKDAVTLTLERNHESNLEYGTLLVYNWKIECFDFLSEFDNVRILMLIECYIPQGVTIPPIEQLNSVVEIHFSDIYGSGVADVLVDVLPLPNLDVLVLSGALPSTYALPTVPSLTDIYVDVPDASNIIVNNTHITGILSFSRYPNFESIYCSIQTLDSIGRFTQVQVLYLPAAVRDLSPLAEFMNLRILYINKNMKIDSLMPLYGLLYLQEIHIKDQAYYVLPKYERAIFTPDNNRYYDRIHVIIGYQNVFSDPNFIHENERLWLENITIDSFDFLLEYPNLRALTILNCDIAEGLVLPRIDTLRDLHIFDTYALQLIQNNTHLPGRLEIGSSLLYVDEGVVDTTFHNLIGIEHFANLSQLIIRAPVYDISPVSELHNLQTFSIWFSDSVQSLTPLSQITRLRTLVINHDAFRALSQEEQEYWEARKWYITRIEWRD